MDARTFTLSNSNGMTVRLADVGATILSVRVPDRNGRVDEVTLGFDTLAEYGAHYFGAVVGRYANRIADGRFSLDGTTYQLARNNGPHHLHGGVRGFDKVVWSPRPRDDHGPDITLSYVSLAGDQGYPGTVYVSVRYLLTSINALSVEYVATTDAPTPINLTQHSYFNLAGVDDGPRSILGHLLTLFADHYTPVDETLIPTGDIAPVHGSPFDFTAAAPVARGYDHNFVLRQRTEELTLAAHVEEPLSGRTLDVFTTEPGVQLYTGDGLDGSVAGRGGHRYGPHSGFCLETQHYPDSPNQPRFPSTILRPGTTFRSRTVFAFGIT